jgi:TPR repeat protein
MQVNSEYYKIDDNHPQLLNKWKLASDNIDNNLLNEGLPQVIHYFNKMNIKEVEPTTQNINGNIFEEDLSIVIDELVNLDFKKINEGKERVVRKKQVFNCINNYKTNSQEIYNWLINNQNNSNSVYLLGYFNYNGIEINIDMQKAFELYQKAAELENDVAQFELANMYIDGEGTDLDYDKAFKIINKLAKK